jgi:predicted transcriptional regulator
MPTDQEAKLTEIANKKGLTGDRKRAFIYGIMRRTGWKPRRERKKDGKGQVVAQG